MGPTPPAVTGTLPRRPEGELRVRLAGTLLVAGSLMGAISLLLPHPESGESVIWAIVAAAAVVGCGLIALGERLPGWGLDAAIAGGCLAINGAIIASGIATGLYGLMFFWIVILAAYFFRPKHAAAHYAFILATYAVTMSVVRQPGYSPVTRWIMVAFAVAVAGAMTSWLASARRRAEQERDLLQLEIERHLADARSQALTDPLTGLPNRRWLDEEVRREISRAQRAGVQLCAAMLDLDHFKRFNDAHGHAEGDSLLTGAADAWRGELRTNDFLARVGGEEFVVLLPECTLDEAELVIDRLRRATPRSQTFSAGLVSWVDGESPEDLFRRADAALYAAKSQGRNRTVVHAGRSQPAAKRPIAPASAARNEWLTNG